MLNHHAVIVEVNVKQNKKCEDCEGKPEGSERCCALKVMPGCPNEEETVWPSNWLNGLII